MVHINKTEFRDLKGKSGSAHHQTCLTAAKMIQASSAENYKVSVA